MRGLDEHDGRTSLSVASTIIDKTRNPIEKVAEAERQVGWESADDPEVWKNLWLE